MSTNGKGEKIANKINTNPLPRFPAPSLPADVCPWDTVPWVPPFTQTRPLMGVPGLPYPLSCAPHPCPSLRPGPRPSPRRSRSYDRWLGLSCQDLCDISPLGTWVLREERRISTEPRDNVRTSAVAGREPKLISSDDGTSKFIQDDIHESMAKLLYCSALWSDVIASGMWQPMGSWVTNSLIVHSRGTGLEDVPRGFVAPRRLAWRSWKASLLPT